MSKLKTKKANDGGPIRAAKEEIVTPVAKKPWWRRFWLTGGLLVISFFIFGYTIVGQLGNINILSGTSVLGQLGHLITNPGEQIDGEAEDRVNILLLGIGGSGHDGPLLTDTIIVASFKPSTSQVAMLSIPRDLVVDFPTYYYRKINNAIYFGEVLGYPGGGEQLSVDMVEDVIGLDIHYFGRIDFAGFEQAVNILDGVEVTVDTAFTDYEFPTDNYGYQTVSFSAGPQMMTGETALNFVRSRHGTNGEGSDFARSLRQQKVLSGIKDKLLSVGTLLNPVKSQQVLNTLSAHISTNMELWEMIRFARIVEATDTANIITAVLDNGNDGLLKSSVGQGGAYILEPRVDNYSEIHQLARTIFEETVMPPAENATVAIHNGTTYTGLAQITADELESPGVRVLEVANSVTRDAVETTIYDLTSGQKPATLAYLTKVVTGAQVSTNLPFYLEDYKELSYDTINASTNPVLGITTSEVVDFLIILGTDALPTVGSSARPNNLLISS